MKETKLLYNGTVKISFEEKDIYGKKCHIYTGEDGKTIKSVTNSTGVIDKSDVIAYWASRVNAEKALILLQVVPEGYFTELKAENKKQWEELERNAIDLSVKTEDIIKAIQAGRGEYRVRKDVSADIGTEAHDFIKKWITLIKKPQIPENEKVRNAVIAFLDFIKKNNLEFISSERLVYSKKYNIVGTLDGIDYDLDDKCLSVDDWKSSNGIYPEMVFQTAGYLMMIEEEIQYLLTLPSKSIKSEEDQRLIELYKQCGGFAKRRLVRFGKYDGEFEVKEFTDHKKDIKAFLNAFGLKTRLDEVKKEFKL
ncbi:MAG: hypothetical protein PHQ35_10600 [Phycisphaerae bacterium]|nr:hypothetical protein [Phycisphaerae bacterium]